MPRFSPAKRFRPVSRVDGCRLCPKALKGALLIPVRFSNFQAQAYTGDYQK
jgi:hypothetical protein